MLSRRRWFVLGVLPAVVASLSLTFAQAASAGDQRLPTRDDVASPIDIALRFDLPPGSTVSVWFDPTTGTCMTGEQSWTVTVTSKTVMRHRLFTSVGATASDPCATRKSRGTWSITTRTPDGYRRTGIIKTETTDDVGEFECHFPAGVDCDVTTPVDKAEVVAVGPIDAETVPGNAPYMECYVLLTYKFAEMWDPSHHGNRYPCTVYGAKDVYFTVDFLPQGVTYRSETFERGTRLGFYGRTGGTITTIGVTAHLPPDEQIKLFKPIYVVVRPILVP